MSLSRERWIREKLLCSYIVCCRCLHHVNDLSLLANLWSSGLFIKHLCYIGICDVSCHFVLVCWWKVSTGSWTAKDGKETPIFIVWFHVCDAVWFTRYSTTVHSRKALLPFWTCFSHFCVSHLLLVDTNVFKSSLTTKVIRLGAGVLGNFGSVWGGDRFCSSPLGTERPWLLAAWCPLGTVDTVAGIVADHPFAATARLRKLPIGESRLLWGGFSMGKCIISYQEFLRSELKNVNN